MKMKLRAIEISIWNLILEAVYATESSFFNVLIRNDVITAPIQLRMNINGNPNIFPKKLSLN